MASTNFVDGQTVIVAAWLNDVNNGIYNTLPLKADLVAGKLPMAQLPTLAKTDVGLGNVDNTSDLNKPISTATQTALNGKEASITAGTTGQYWRGDKSWQTLDKTAVGLANVDNTSDANKPLSTAIKALTGDATSSINHRNRIINGDMRFDQRNLGSSFSVPAGSTYTLDRWLVAASVSGVMNAQRITSTVGTAPHSAGFPYVMNLSVASVASPTAAQFYVLAQAIEGNSIADLQWGTAAAQSITISFFVSVPVSGTYSFRVGNGGQTRSYVFTKSLTSGWNQVTQTVPGDTTGSWASDSSAGLYLSFDLGSGSNFETASTNTWLAGDYRRTSSSVRFVSQTAGSVYALTGVQLEAGSVATPFERRPYGLEQLLCQRYALRLVAGSMTGSGVWYSASTAIHQFTFPVLMRTTPTFTNLSAAIFAYTQGSSTTSTAGVSTMNQISQAGVELFTNFGSSASSIGFSTSTSINSGALFFSAEL